MSIAISGAGSASSANVPDPSKMASRIASKMMTDLDVNKDGSIDKKEFVTGLTSKGVSAEDAGKMFDAVDTRKTGSINKADIESAVKSGALEPPEGGRPPGGPRGPSAGGGNAQSYDPADTNKDGTVTAQEALLYSMKHPSNTHRQTTELAKLGNHVDKTV